MTILILVFLVVSVLYALIIRRYTSGWKAVSAPLEDKGSEGNGTFRVFISVIIAARNEEHNIPGLINSLKTLEYPTALFEVIIVDDHSTDQTLRLLKEAQPDFSNLVVRQLVIPAEDVRGIPAYKKRAIESGIAGARGSLIVTTDADCRFHPLWLQRIAAFHQQTGAVCIAAPVVIESGPSLLSLFQALDFMVLQGITAAAVHQKLHMMCNGANFIYTRKAYNEVNGFSDIDNIPSGDDMFLMHKIYEKYPDRVFYLKDPDAIVTTAPAGNWKAFFQQRIRWASKSVHYKDRNIIGVLAMVYLYNLLFLVLGIIVIFFPQWIFLLVLFLLAKILIEFPFVNMVAGFFGIRRLLWYFIIFQPLHIIYTIISGWLGSFGSYKWKDREVSTSLSKLNRR